MARWALEVTVANACYNKNEKNFKGAFKKLNIQNAQKKRGKKEWKAVFFCEKCYKKATFVDQRPYIGGCRSPPNICTQRKTPEGPLLWGTSPGVFCASHGGWIKDEMHRWGSCNDLRKRWSSSEKARNSRSAQQSSVALTRNYTAITAPKKFGSGVRTAKYRVKCVLKGHLAIVFD